MGHMRLMGPHEEDRVFFVPSVPYHPILVFKADDFREHLPNVKKLCRFLLLTLFAGAVYFLSCVCVFVPDRGFQMAQQFSSRQEAQDHAFDLMQQEQAAYWPKGYRYQTFPEVFRLMNRPAATWTYHAPDASQGTMVVMHNPTKTTKEYTVLAKHKGEWYCDFPEPPYLLYQRYEWINAETVYVCEGERTADAVEALGLAATTS